MTAKVASLPRVRKEEANGENFIRNGKPKHQVHEYLQSKRKGAEEIPFLLLEATCSAGAEQQSGQVARSKYTKAA